MAAPASPVPPASSEGPFSTNFQEEFQKEDEKLALFITKFALLILGIFAIVLGDHYPNPLAGILIGCGTFMLALFILRIVKENYPFFNTAKNSPSAEKIG